MYILGISCFYHDSAACLIKNGVLLSAAEEERFTRKKHDHSFPENAVRFCLDEAKIDIASVDYVAFYEKPLLKFERILHQHIEMFPKSLLTFCLALPSWINEKLRIQKIIKKKLQYKKSILYVPHHLSHAASCFFVSPFQKSAIVTIDGVGEWQTTTIGLGEGNSIRLMKEINFPHSLGLLYSTVTAHLGFKVNNDEYKVMGLAAYGQPRYVEDLKKVIDIKEDGSYSLNMEYFEYHYAMRMPSQKFIDLFGPPRAPESALEPHHKDIAASVQKLLEEIVLKICNFAHTMTQAENICLAGGTALNSVINGKILKHTPFKQIYIQPEAGDGGGCIGAAFYAYNGILKNEREYAQKDACLGPSYSNDEIKKFFHENKIQYKEFSNETKLI